ncbi:LexA family transcriptional regulator [Sphingomonas sp.]|uniref:S24 family peptidase n=1 Tax=Sphingomonas sp. TaxID=28214 RepID=UPI001B071F12|nr:LexA family transcriptional regulator [Sphingomonas sp.]MBO9711405.1 LexA family transcriptional regulator [Sphingomonas sp.]
MDTAAQRAALAALIAEHGASYARLSRLLGRNDAYLQQFVTRGSPRELAERDRALLARYFGVPEVRLGGPEPAGLVEVARLDVGASAGPGGLVDSEARRRPGGFSPELLRALGVRPEAASMIRVAGDSMLPTLEDGDEILVDRDRRRIESDGIHVARIDGELVVKRLRPTVGGVEVVSDNPDYPVRVYALRDVEVIGRVVWLGRALG